MGEVIEKKIYRVKFDLFKSKWDITLNFREDLNFIMLVYKDNKHLYTMYRRY